MTRRRPLLIMGTRPEAIKMAPVVHAFRAAPAADPIVCFTGQHREMLAQVAEYFDLQPDEDFQLMQPNQSLSGLTARCLEELDACIHRWQPHCLVAQGDTTTVMAASVAAFYRQLPFVHVEAGLRTGNLQSPWPEEFNRRVAGLTTSLHCAPTQRAADNLLAEGVPTESVYVTGNTVIDALQMTIQRERQRGAHWQKKYDMLARRRVILVTGHRRENFGEKFDSVCRAIVELSALFPDSKFVYPVHLNPNVRKPVFHLLGNRPNIHLIEPVGYPEFVWLMDRSSLILTDSGGVQEEAPSLGKPILVMRDTTERPEAVEAGAALLVGTDKKKIVDQASLLLRDPQAYARRQIDRNPYGDGHASERIVQLALSRLGEWTTSESRAA